MTGSEPATKACGRDADLVVLGEEALDEVDAIVG
jgi:hypothetical protein